MRNLNRKTQSNMIIILYQFRLDKLKNEVIDKEKAPGPDRILPEFILNLDYGAAVINLMFSNFVLLAFVE